MSELEMNKEFEKFTGKPFVKDFNHLIPIYNKCYSESLNTIVNMLLNWMYAELQKPMYKFNIIYATRR